MPVMEIPLFRDEIRISDLESFYRFRLSQTTVLWPDQAIGRSGNSSPIHYGAYRRTLT